MTISSSDYEVRIFDPRGVPLRDIRVAPTYSFVLNDIGDCTFEMSTMDNAFREETIQFGNFVVINHTHLPSWVGMIEPTNSRTWNNGYVSVYALSAENIFNLRFTQPSKFSGTGGAIFKEFLDNLNEDNTNGIKIEAGSIVQGGRHVAYPLMGRGGDMIKWLTRATKTEYSVTPEYDSSGQLILAANLYGQKGTDTQSAFDSTNTEMTDSILVEDGEIFNYVVFFTSPQSGGKTLIIGNPQYDEESIGRFGLRQYLGEMGAEDTQTLDEAARIFLYQSAYPKKTVTPSVLNVNDFWRKLDTGNLYWWETPLAGFTNGVLGAKEYTRLSGMEVVTPESKVNVMIDRFDTTYTWRQIWTSLYG